MWWLENHLVHIPFDVINAFALWVITIISCNKTYFIVHKKNISKNPSLKQHEAGKDKNSTNKKQGNLVGRAKKRGVAQINNVQAGAQRQLKSTLILQYKVN